MLLLIEHNMHFEIAHKWVFLLLPLPLLVYWLIPPLHKKRSGLFAPFFQRAVEITRKKPKNSAWVSRKNIFSTGALVLCWIGLLAAASSPQLVGQPEKKTKTVRSFLVAADISFSMAQRDWNLNGKQVTRWDAVKFLMKDFLKERKSDQVGLEMFATHAYLQAPLTTDLEVINWLLDETEVGMAGQMTSIGEAISFGIKIFREDSIKQRVMLLMTDGVDGGKEILPLDAAEAAKRDSITIYTLGIGNTASGGYAIDETLLTQIAQTTGGKYFRADNPKEMQQVYAELNKLQPIIYEDDSYKPVILLYIYPLGVTIVLALLVFFINGITSRLRNIK